MPIFASITNAVVTDLFVSDSAEILPPGEYVPAHRAVYVGCPYENGVFVGVVDPGPEPEPEPAPPSPPTDPVELLAWAKAERLTQLATAFAAAEASGWLASSLGFDIDATERANRDVAGLITVMSQPGAPETTYFCDHHNQMRPVTLANLHTMQLEIITYGQNLYAQKWQIRTAIEAAETVDAVQAVVIAFGGDPIAPDTSDTDPAPEATA